MRSTSSIYEIYLVTWIGAPGEDLLCGRIIIRKKGIIVKTMDITGLDKKMEIIVTSLHKSGSKKWDNIESSKLPADLEIAINSLP